MLDDNKRSKIFELRENGFSLSKISKSMHIPISTVQYILSPKDTNGAAHTGRPRKIKQNEKKVIKEAIRRLDNKMARITADRILKNTKLDISLSTVRRHLVRSNYKYKNIRQKIILTNDQKLKRFECVRNWIYKGINFEKVIFSDEKKFNLDGPDNYCSWTNTSSPKILRNKRQCGGGSVMVHGAISSAGKCYIQIVKEKINSQVYLGILKNVIAYFPMLKKDYIYQHDLAPAHASKVTKEFLLNKKVRTLEWPSKSPDLNIIEYMWKIFSDSVYGEHQYSTKHDLEGTILKCAEVINDANGDQIKNLYNGMTDRICKIIQTGGEML